MCFCLNLDLFDYSSLVQCYTFMVIIFAVVNASFHFLEF